MEHQANAANPAQAEETHSVDTNPASPNQVERPLITPKEFIRLIYMLSGAAVLLLSLAIWFMMSLA